MTLGFACAAWTPKDELAVVVAADTRISSNGSPLTDAGVKTYELGGRCAMVASGHALPPMMAAELTRSLVENHNRKTPERKIGFFDTARLASFFLKRAASEQGAVCKVALAGFLKAGAPCVASVVVSPDFNRVAFRPVARGGTIAIPVGEPSGARLLLEAMAAAKRQGRLVIPTAIGILLYTSRHEGAFRSIGGGISVGACMGAEEHFSWPLVEIDGQRFLRGMNVTEFHRPDWPAPEVVPYDDDWCAEQDQRTSLAPSEPSYGGTLPGFDIDAIATPETLFAATQEPDLASLDSQP